jgi:hypothetical protein
MCASPLFISVKMETQEIVGEDSSPAASGDRPRHHSSTATDPNSLMTIVFHIYSSSASASSSRHLTDNGDPSPTTTFSPATDELIAQFTIFVTEYEHKLKLNSLKSLIYETFQHYLASPTAAAPTPALTSPTSYRDPSVEPSQTYHPHPPSLPHSTFSHQQCSTTIDIPRLSLKSWQELLRSDPFLSANDTPITIFLLLSNIDKLRQFFSSVKHCDSLMFVTGDHSQDLDIYSNWIHDEDHVTISDFLRSLHKKNHHEYDDTDSPLPPPQVLSFVLAHGYEMPAPNIRVLLQKTRTATDMYGKNYTVYSMVVIQGKLEWTIDHRYSGRSPFFSRFHSLRLLIFFCPPPHPPPRK